MRFFSIAIAASISLSAVACAHAKGGPSDPTRTSAASDEGGDCSIAKLMEDPKAPQMCAEQCERRQAEACSTLGAMYEQGHLVPARDAAKARTSYARGCELGYMRSCQSLGKLT
jgi:TPR repeat protein